MDVKDAPKSPSTKPGVPQRSIASSLKSIIQSRHPNTRRNIKRRPEGPIIYDMIVVKNYDQMDSLRQVLSLPPRIHGPSPVEVQMKNSEAVSALPERVASAAMTASTGETLGKRKCATEPVPPLSDEKVERTIKKRRISIGIQDIINLDMPKSPQVQRQKVYGKRNFPTRRFASTEKIPKVLWENEKEMYSWPAFLKRVDKDFGLPNLLVDTRT